MGLSTNVLWHQTDFDGLKAILTRRSFTCSYSLETIKWKGSELIRAFPMVSFCDIPFADMCEYLTNLDDQVIGKYGKYTIGMKRSWGRNNGLSPVWYRDKNSISLRIQKEIFEKLKDKPFHDYSDEEKFLWHVLAHTKNHEGKLKKYAFKSYRFYDEREHRYVPDFDIVISKGYQPSLLEAEYEKYKNEHNELSLIPEIQVQFNIEDIAYILVSNANQIDHIKKLFEGEDIHGIVIMSYKQVLNDIIGINHNRKL